MIFKRTPVYLKIFVNKIEITNLKTGENIARISPHNFSSDRIVLAEFNTALKFVQTVLKDDLKIGEGLFPRQLKVLVQQMVPVTGGLAEIEKRAMRDLGEQIGGTSVIVLEHSRNLSDTEAMLELK